MHLGHREGLDEEILSNLFLRPLTAVLVIAVLTKIAAALDSSRIEVNVYILLMIRLVVS